MGGGKLLLEPLRPRCLPAPEPPPRLSAPTQLPRGGSPRGGVSPGPTEPSSHPFVSGQALQVCFHAKRAFLFPRPLGQV